MGVVLANNDSTGTTAAFTASEFGSGEAFASNEFEERKVKIITFGWGKLEADVVDGEDEFGGGLDELARQFEAINDRSRWCGYWHLGVMIRCDGQENRWRVLSCFRSASCP